jgi:hypothetical protein
MLKIEPTHSGLQIELTRLNVEDDVFLFEDPASLLILDMISKNLSLKKGYIVGNKSNIKKLQHLFHENGSLILNAYYQDFLSNIQLDSLTVLSATIKDNLLDSFSIYLKANESILDNINLDLGPNKDMELRASIVSRVSDFFKQNAQYTYPYITCGFDANFIYRESDKFKRRLRIRVILEGFTDVEGMKALRSYLDDKIEKRIIIAKNQIIFYINY